MTTAIDKERILDRIETLIEELSIEDAADLLSIQLATTIAQGSSDQEDALAFLREVTHDMADYLRYVDFEAIEAEIEAEGPDDPSSVN